MARIFSSSLERKLEVWSSSNGKTGTLKDGKTNNGGIDNNDDNATIFDFYLHQGDLCKRTTRSWSLSWLTEPPFGVLIFFWQFRVQTVATVMNATGVYRQYLTGRTHAHFFSLCTPDVMTGLAQDMMSLCESSQIHSFIGHVVVRCSFDSIPSNVFFIFHSTDNTSVFSCANCWNPTELLCCFDRGWTLSPTGWFNPKHKDFMRNVTRIGCCTVAECKEGEMSGMRQVWSTTADRCDGCWGCQTPSDGERPHELDCRNWGQNEKVALGNISNSCQHWRLRIEHDPRFKKTNKRALRNKLYPTWMSQKLVRILPFGPHFQNAWCYHWCLQHARNRRRRWNLVTRTSSEETWDVLRLLVSQTFEGKKSQSVRPYSVYHALTFKIPRIQWALTKTSIYFGVVGRQCIRDPPYEATMYRHMLTSLPAKGGPTYSNFTRRINFTSRPHGRLTSGSS